MNLWGWVLAVHVLCAVLWVGGMFFAYVVLRPSLSVLEPMQPSRSTRRCSAASSW